uniref:Uncharacterized protein n=1 Tax=Romanomermis culicivorax TaxID=13658 RepID=A0A915JXQ3_ROMCU
MGDAWIVPLVMNSSAHRAMLGHKSCSNMGAASMTSAAMSASTWDGSLSNAHGKFGYFLARSTDQTASITSWMGDVSQDAKNQIIRKMPLQNQDTHGHVVQDVLAVVLDPRLQNLEAQMNRKAAHTELTINEIRKQLSWNKKFCEMRPMCSFPLRPDTMLGCKSPFLPCNSQEGLCYQSCSMNQKH